MGKKKSKLLNGEINKIIGDYIRSIRPNDNFFYEPKEKEESRVSVLEALYEFGKWNINVQSHEHNVNDLNRLKLLIADYLNNSNIIKEERIIRIILPVDYFENNQVLKTDLELAK